jgi:cytidylate kinase
LPALIAIDGPAGSGKSTVAAKLAALMGYDRLDTGAMYRVVALRALTAGVEPGDHERLVALVRSLDIDVGERVLVDGEDVTEAIRAPAVDEAVSAYAADAEVRAELVRRQRRWAEGRPGVVAEGRDIGTVVFPDAPLKVFLTARLEERARRREGRASAEALAERDQQDAGRQASPLKPALDAVVIDSSELGVDDVVAKVLALAERAGLSARRDPRVARSREDRPVPSDPSDGAEGGEPAE